MTTHDNDFAQFTGRLDESVSPSPRFAKDLRARLSAMPEATRPTPIQEAEPVQPQPFRMSLGVDPEIPAPRRKLSFLPIAAVLTVFFLVGALLYQQWQMYQSAEPTSEIRYADTPLATGTPQTAGLTLLPDMPEGAWVHTISGDTLYGLTTPALTETGASSFFAYDLAEQKMMWHHDFTNSGGPAVNGNTVIVPNYPDLPGSNDPETFKPEDVFPSVTALDATTGKQLWKSQSPTEPSDSGVSVLSNSSVVIVGDHAYMAYSNGVLAQWDLATGQRVDTAFPSAVTLENYVPQLISTKTDLYLAYGANLWKVDQKDLASWEPVSLPVTGKGYISSTYGLDDVAIIDWYSYDRQGYTQIALDYATGSVLWTHSAPGFLVKPTQSGETVTLITNLVKQRPWFVRFLPRMSDYDSVTTIASFDRTTGEEIVWYQTSEDAWIPGVAIDRGYCMAANNITCVREDGSNVTMEFPAAPNHTQGANSDLWTWNGQLVVFRDGRLYLSDPLP